MLDYLVMNIKKKNRTYEAKAITYRASIFLFCNEFSIILSIFFRVVYCFHYLELFRFVSKCFTTYQENYC